MSTAGLQRTLTDIARLPQTGTLKAAKEVEKIAREVAGSVGPVHLGKRKRTVRLRAITRRKEMSGSTATVVVYGVPTGPWVWVTSGTSRHVIPKKTVRQAANRKVRYIKGDRYDHPYGKQVVHPGASGRGAWKRVVQRAERDAMKVFVAEARKVMGRG